MSCLHFLIIRLVSQMLGDIDKWGIDVFSIGDLSCNRPLTAVTYTIFQVSTRQLLLATPALFSHSLAKYTRYNSILNIFHRKRVA